MLAGLCGIYSPSHLYFPGNFLGAFLILPLHCFFNVIAILLSSVKLSYEEIKHRILAVDEGNLTPGLLAQLIKCIPEPEVLKKLAALKDCYADLAEPEQFAVVVCDSFWLVKFNLG